MWRGTDNLTSEFDEVCSRILVALLKNASNFAGLQRSVGAGSARTIKKHAKHLTDKGLIEVNRERRGVRFYYNISLTEKGTKVASDLAGTEKELIGGQ